MSTKIFKSENLDKKTRKLFFSLLSILIGFAVASLLILMIGESPLQFISNIFKGNTYSLEAFGNFLATFSWMLLIGLSVAVSFRAGLFNIGVAGQMMAGGIAGYIWAYFITGLGRFGVIFSIFIPMLAGMLIAAFIGWLKAKFEVNEVISSIMINWIIYFLYKWVTNPTYSHSFVNDAGLTSIIDPSNSLRAEWLNNLFGANSLISIGIFIALIAFALLFLVYKFSTWGKKQDLIGSNPDAAKYSGINQKRELIKTMALSGALAGLAGSVYYLGVNESLPTLGTDLPAEPFNGITISLIAFNSIGGVFFSALFVAMIYNSSIYVSSTLNPMVGSLILGIIVLVISISQYFIIYEPFKKLKARKVKVNQTSENDNVFMDYQNTIETKIIPKEIINNKVFDDFLIQQDDQTPIIFTFIGDKGVKRSVLKKDHPDKYHLNKLSLLEQDDVDPIIFTFLGNGEVKQSMLKKAYLEIHRKDFLDSDLNMIQEDNFGNLKTSKKEVEEK